MTTFARFFCAGICFVMMAAMVLAQERGRNPVLPFSEGGTTTYRALLIGNADYRHWPKLKTPVRDADSLAKLLIRDYGFSAANTRVLKNATREEMLSGLDWLRRRSRADDRVLVYYAGHGEFDEREDGYWVPVDGFRDNTFRHLSNADVLNRLRAIDARHKLLIADSCFSGTLLTRGNVIRPEKGWQGSGYFRKKSRLKSVLGLTSGGNEPVSDGGPEWNGHSIFTYHLLRQLETSRGPFLSATELGLAVTRHVANDTASLGKSAQTPLFQAIMNQGHQGGEFFFVRPDFRPLRTLIAYRPEAASAFENVADSARKTMYEGLLSLLRRQPEISILPHLYVLPETAPETELKKLMHSAGAERALVFSLRGRTKPELTLLWQGVSKLEIEMRAYAFEDAGLLMLDAPELKRERLPLRNMNQAPGFLREKYARTAEKLLKSLTIDSLQDALPNFLE